MVVVMMVVVLVVVMVVEVLVAVIVEGQHQHSSYDHHFIDVRTLDTPQKRSGMARVLTLLPAHSRIHPQSE